MNAEQPASIAVCIPIYEDWPSAMALLDQLDRATAPLPYPVHVLFIDDGSNEGPPDQLPRKPSWLARVAVLRLRRNLGHQRAIAIGLTSLYVAGSCTAVVVMDGDGEDRPDDVPRLIQSCAETEWSRVVFAQRTKRSEGLLFRLGYLFFKILHRLLVHRKIEVGNFSVIPRALLARLVSVSELWNHYAAAVYQAHLPVHLVPTTRARRIAGESRMNFNALVLHGLSAISVYSDAVGVRVLWLIGVAMLAVIGGVATVIAIRLNTNLAIPGWATTATGMLLVSLLNLTLISMMMVLFMLRSRSEYGFLPIRDYLHFVLDERVLHQKNS